VIVFFDEMDSIFRTRGSGVSSDVENTIVPQLLSEIDGVEGLENVIVIGASNREDMIDPAILRPGRLDVKIKIERPDAEAAKDIKEFLETGQKGLRVAHLLSACVDEFSENEDLPNTTNPDDWARISGKKGERIVYIRTLVSGKQGTEAGRSIDTVANTGQYL